MIQLQFLNYLLNSKDYSLLTINNIGSEFFPSYKNEFEYIKEHIDKYNCIPDKATFIDKFNDFDIVEVNENPNYLIDALFEDRDKRFLANTFNSIRNLLNEGKVEDAMQLYTSKSADAVKAKHIESFDILDAEQRYDNYVDKCNDYNKY